LEKLTSQTTGTARVGSFLYDNQTGRSIRNRLLAQILSLITHVVDDDVDTGFVTAEHDSHAAGKLDGVGIDDENVDL
jgi:hypothetical protein